MGITIRDEAARHRYELYFDDTLAGVEVYELGDGLISFRHTEVYEAFAGKGLAKVLVRHVLDDARRRGLGVLPYCPYVRKFIDEHAAEYLDLVPPERRAQFGWKG